MFWICNMLGNTVLSSICLQEQKYQFPVLLVPLASFPIWSVPHLVVWLLKVTLHNGEGVIVENIIVNCVPQAYAGPSTGLYRY